MEGTTKVQVRTKILGVLMRDARTVCGRDVKDCADMLGISSAQYLAYEQGDRAISLPELETFAHFTKIPLTHFWQTDLLAATGNQQPPDVRVAQNLRHRLIGAELRKARINARMQIGELAEKAGIPTTKLNSYELGERPIPLPELEFLAEILQIPSTQFISTSGVVGEWLTQQQASQRFAELPTEMQVFLSDPANMSYLRVAQRLADLPVDRLRQLATDLLEITL